MPDILSVRRPQSGARPRRIPASRQRVAPTDACRDSPWHAAALPRVSLHLATGNEPPARVRRTLDAVSRLDYPDYEVLVIDSNTVDPALWEPIAEHCARLGSRFRFFQLGPWPGGKAGALNFALQETAPDVALIGVLNAGAVTRADWLRRVAPHFTDPSVGIAWSRPVQPAGVPDDALPLVRHAAIAAAGGWAEWTIAEEAELHLRLQRDGWNDVAASADAAAGDAPEDFAALSRRRFRHACGAMQICRRHWLTVLSPFGTCMTPRQRGAALAGWLSCLGDAFAVLSLLVTLAWSVGLILMPRHGTLPQAGMMLIPVLPIGFRLAQQLGRAPAGRRLGAVLAALSLIHASGTGAWRGLLAAAPAAPDTVAETAGRRLTDRLAAARQPFILALLALGVIAGTSATQDFGRPAPWLWCGMLLVQALPCFAAALAPRAHRDAAWISRVAHKAIPL